MESGAFSETTDSNRTDLVAPRQFGRNDGTKTREKNGVGIEPGMVRLWMNLGNRSGVRPGDIVGAIAGEAGIPGKAIGEINIQPTYSLVDVSEKHVASVLKHSQRAYRIKGKPVHIRRDDPAMS